MSRDLETFEGKIQFQEELRHLPDWEFERRFREASTEEYPYFLLVDFQQRCDTY